MDSLFVIITRARASTHISSIESRHETFRISKTTIKQTLKNINIIAIHHAMSILLHKHRFENNQPLLDQYDLL